MFDERHDYIVVTQLGTRDPDGSKLRRMLQAQAAMERAQRLRSTMGGLLAWLSAPLALVAARPAALLPGLRTAAVAAWAAGAGGLVIAALCSWTYGRRRASLEGELEAQPRRAP
jgi:hypothetical protein